MLIVAIFLALQQVFSLPTKAPRWSLDLPHEQLGLSLEMIIPRSSLSIDQKRRIVELRYRYNLPHQQIVQKTGLSYSKIAAFTSDYDIALAVRNYSEFRRVLADYRFDSDFKREKMISSIPKIIELYKQQKNSSRDISAISRAVDISVSQVLKVINMHKNYHEARNIITKYDRTDKEDIRAIIAMRDEGYKYPEIAAQFPNVQLVTVYNILEKSKDPKYRQRVFAEPDSTGKRKSGWPAYRSKKKLNPDINPWDQSGTGDASSSSSMPHSAESESDHVKLQVVNEEDLFALPFNDVFPVEETEEEALVRQILENPDVDFYGQ